MTIFWVNPQGVLLNATDDSQTVIGATAVTTPPDNGVLQIWDFVSSSWVDVANRTDIVADSEIKSSFESSRISRLLFEIEFDQENRLRVLEGKSSITKIQYRDALKIRLLAL